MVVPMVVPLAVRLGLSLVALKAVHWVDHLAVKKVATMVE